MNQLAFQIKTHQRIIDIIIEWMLDKSELSFFGNFLSRISYKEDKNLPTCAVRANQYGFELIYGSKYIEEASDLDLRHTLIHEVFHCLNRHLSRIEDLNHDMLTANISADVVVNYLTSYYENRYPDKVKAELDIVRKPEEYDGLMIYENVYTWIKEKQKERQQNNCKASNGSGGSGSGKKEKNECSSDCNGNCSNNNSKELEDILDHLDNSKTITIVLEDGTEGITYEGSIDVHLPDTISEEEAKDMARNVVENIRQTTRGRIPGNVEECVKIQKRKEDPVKKLKKASSNLCFTSRGRTFRKMNRRQIEGIKGVRREGFTINCIVDVSGSMSGLVERSIGVILNTETTVNLIKIDTQVRDHEVLRRSTDMKEFTYKGGVGTVLQPSIDYVLGKKELKNNGTLLITDGYTDSLDLSGLHHVIIATVGKEPPIKTESKKFEVLHLEV